VPITSLNLSLSNRCTASCVFCPEDRGKNEYEDMPLTVAQRVINEVVQEDFPWEVHTIQVGENGDAPLNPAFLSILRFIRGKMPKVRMSMATNFSHLQKRMSRVILKEGLIDVIHTNIDGHNRETNFVQKGLNLARVFCNIKDFLGEKEHTGGETQLAVSVLTLDDYTEAVLKHFGKLPQKLKVVPLESSSFEEVEKSLEWLPYTVGVNQAKPFAWAERGSIERDPKNYQCPMLPRVKNEAFISPRGNWYPCCMDSNQEQAYGNVMEKSLVTMHKEEARNLLIHRLEGRHFKEIGSPCNEVWCCGVMQGSRK